MSKIKSKDITQLYFFDFIGTYGGAQQSTVALLNKIQEDYKSVLEPSVIIVNGTNSQFIESLKVPIFKANVNNRIDIFKVGKKKFQAISYFISCALKIKKIIKSRNNNNNIVILCNSSKALYTLSILKALNLDFKIYFYSRGWGRKSDFNVVSIYILNKLVTKILCVSHQTRENMSKFIHNHDKISVTYTSINLDVLDKFTYCKNLDVNNIKMLFAGAIIPMKGLKDLLEGIKALPTKYQEKIELSIAGIHNTKEVTEYFNECKEVSENIISRIQWLGWRNDIPRLIADADIVCLPSYSEGLPRIVQESMYMSKLVICTPVGGVPSLIEDNITGYLIKVGSKESIKSALIKCFESPFIKQIQENARQHINNHFHLNTQAKLVVDTIVYENKQK